MNPGDNDTEGPSTLEGDDFSERFGRMLKEKLAPLSLEERRAYFIRLAAKLGWDVELVDPKEPPPESDEPK